ncbi:MAG: hypothetical protein C4334_01150 [Pyrinomonas sp.]|uniref:hypothetical protein n=1 Tax=Pyrinomonas sp. TaxID=2080306 RepID=UPI0033225FAA
MRLNVRPSLFFPLMLLASSFGAAAVVAQQPQRPSPSGEFVRTTTRREMRRFPYGGAISLFGAPQGSVTVESWSRAEVEITAETEIRASSEDDLALLARVTDFVLDEEPNRLRIFTTGTHDRRTLKRLAPDFPRRLLNAWWKVDYLVRVPPQTDLEIYTGRGALRVGGVEGNIKLNAAEAEATLELSGGDVMAVIGRGKVNVRLTAPSWRGRGANVNLASGELIVELPAGLNADLRLSVLRTGRILDETNRSIKKITPEGRASLMRFGAGGAVLAFTIGDGTLRLVERQAMRRPFQDRMTQHPSD